MTVKRRIVCKSHIFLSALVFCHSQKNLSIQSLKLMAIFTAHPSIQFSKGTLYILLASYFLMDS